jgi:hypothetical protein
MLRNSSGSWILNDIRRKEIASSAMGVKEKAESKIEKLPKSYRI